MKTLTRTLTGAAGTVALASVSVPALASIIAQDDFSVPPYALGALNGQAVGGTGFTGSWATVPGLEQDLSVVANGAIGRPSVTGGNGGDYANFASPFSLSTGQLFISYTMDNVGGTSLSTTRLDLNLDTPPVAGDRAVLGGFQPSGDFGLGLEGALGGALAQSSISATGTHKVVGVLDATNDQIAIFVDPTSSSFYDTNGANDADAVAAWTPPGRSHLQQLQPDREPERPGEFRPRGVLDRCGVGRDRCSGTGVDGIACCGSSGSWTDPPTQRRIARSGRVPPRVVPGGAAGCLGPGRGG
jgi:hypothetical protein